MTFFIGPFLHFMILVSILLVFNLVPKQYQAGFALLLPVTNEVFMTLTRTRVMRVNPDCARQASQFHSVMKEVFSIMLYGAAIDYMTLIALIAIDVVVMLYQGTCRCLPPLPAGEGFWRHGEGYWSSPVVVLVQRSSQCFVSVAVLTRRQGCCRAPTSRARCSRRTSCCRTSTSTTL